jgi:predicted nucleic acid-binding Zn ribbon protein
VPDEDRVQLAREALARAKADARARGNRPAWPGTTGQQRGQSADGGPGGRPAGGGESAGSPAAGASAGSGDGFPVRGRGRRDDPEPLNSAIRSLIDGRGWREAAAGGSVFSRWAEIVGPDLAAHTRPDGLADGELTVIADSTAWATQLRLLAAELVRRPAAEVGDGVVLRVRVRGPAAAAGPPRRPGEWRVRGSRGPRDTYG